MTDILRNILEYLSSLLYPKRCMFCGEILVANAGGWLDGLCCEDCFGSLEFMENESQIGDSVHLIKNYSAFVYDGAARDMIHKLKFRGKRRFAKGIAHIMAAIINCGVIDKIDFFVPVPLHIKRFKQRGYNQAAELCNELSLIYNIPVNNCLKRIRDTPAQSKLSAADRMVNIRGAFAFENDKNVQNKNIMLVDDIYTTGSTLNECVRILIESGAASVYCMTAAKTRYIDKKQIYIKS